ncbi:unnamed protein product [Allacma fusca]|uniref:Fatty acyl-CoA reductase n=2 Tax=Allacma fusca TaxID=39272 RepID=A0A8J2JN73_9HEXA|nr:unnamed protein product [Allacma fusca]
MEFEKGISDFYAGRSIFITGATGFVGKCILNKLLTSCSEIVRIYALVRVKPDSMDEIQQGNTQSGIVDSKVFELILKDRPDLLDKICYLKGDMTLPNCGFDKAIMELIRDVEIVIHCAGAIYFNMNLPQVMKINVGGTYNVLTVAMSMRNVKAFVYVSTAFCMHHDTPLEEKVYETNIGPLEAWKSFQNMSQECLQSLTKTILEEKPNSYSYSKYMAENLVESFKDQIPVCVVRPGAILGAYKEPFLGWSNTSSSISRYYHMLFSGYYQTLLINQNGTFAVTPVDYAVNTILAAAWRRGAFSDSGFVVYNCVPTAENLVLHGQIINWGYESVTKGSNPLVRYIFSPGYSTSNYIFRLKNRLCFEVCSLLKDPWSRNRKHSLENQLKKFKIAETFMPFSLNEWNFITTNMKQLHQEMNPEDQKIFYIDFGQINWECFVKSFVDGLSLY